MSGQLPNKIAHTMGLPLPFLPPVVHCACTQVLLYRFPHLSRADFEDTRSWMGKEEKVLLCKQKSTCMQLDIQISINQNVLLSKIGPNTERKC